MNNTRPFVAKTLTMRYPAVFVNHGGGPLPLLGRQPKLVDHMKEVVQKHLPDEPPKAIVIISAHWESDPIKITGAQNPSMYFDYYGFPEESYKFNYPAPGSPSLAKQIHSLLEKNGLESEIDEKRGYDHGVFVPLMIMFPKADIPVVEVSLHSSLSAQKHIDLGQALAPLREEGVLILGSGYTFHNLEAMIRNPSKQSYKEAENFNNWLKDIMLGTDPLGNLQQWAKAPGARVAHPREEHLLPLLVTAATGGQPQIVYDHSSDNENHAISGYKFQ